MEDANKTKEQLVSELTQLRERLAGLEAPDGKRGQVEEDLRQRNRELELLNQASQVVMSSLNLDQVLASVLEEVRHLLGVAASSAWLLDPETDEVVCRQATGPGNEIVRGWRLAPGEGIAGWVARAGKPVLPAPVGAAQVATPRGPGSLVVPDTRADERHFGEVDRQTGTEMRSMLSVPLQIRGDVIGVIQVLDTEVGRFSSSDSRLIESLAGIASIAVENARLYEQAQQEIAERVRVEEQVHRRNRELELLNWIVTASHADLEPETLLETACRELAKTFDLPHAAAALLNEEKTAAVVIAEYSSASAPASVLSRPDQTALPAPGASRPPDCPGQAGPYGTGQMGSPGDGPAQVRAERRRPEDRPSLLGQTISIENSPLFQHLLTHKASLVVDDTRPVGPLGGSDSRLAPVHDLMRERGTASLLILPLIIGGEVVGSLALESAEPRQFSVEEVSLAWGVADQVAGALARTRLAQSQQRLVTAIEQTAESVVILNSEGTILYVNPAFQRITGYSRAKSVGQSLDILRSGEQDDAFFEELWATISAGNVWQGRIVGEKENGTLYTLETTITPVRNEGGAIVSYVSVQRDVTRELQLEEQYLQAQKMEAVGQLTAGIAHDFNNLLTAVNGFAELLQFTLAPDDPAHEFALKILDSGRRAADLVRQLLAFSRKQILEPKVLNLNAVVAEMEVMLRHIIGEHIDLKTRLTPELWPVKVDLAQLEQVVVNLAVNARDAMPDGGKLTIETANVVLDEGYAASHLDTQPGEYVLLAVSDTGLGMSEEVKAHIFEPFFTTKGRGQGTGLGLATVFGIVKQSGGSIWVYTEEDVGTTFKIYLPQAEEARRLFTRPEAVRELPSGGETILVVEDEAPVRDLARNVLEMQGYTVLEARDGQEALLVFAQHRDPIHLLLTDVVMPGIGGKALAEQLSQAHPALKILFMSGYTDNAIARHGVLNPHVDFLQKPFTPTDLAREVRRLLDG